MHTQKQFRLSKAVSIASATLLLAASATGAFGQAAYQYIDIGAALSGDSVASAINDVGQIVGSGGAHGSSTWQAWRWSAGTATVLPSLNGTSAWANDINNAGEIVGGISRFDAGTVWPGTAINAVIWRNDQATALTQLGAFGWAQAYSINDAGVVVGGYDPRSDPISYLRQHAAQWDPSGQLSMLPGGHAASLATSINSQGTAVGMVGDWQGSSHDPASALPAKWSPSLVTLQPVPRYSATAWDINDRGQIVGYSGNRYGSPGQAVLWEDGMTTVLGDPQAEGNALALNEHTQIVGYAVVNGQYRATLWQGGSTIDLNAQIDPTVLEGGWVLTSASDINESGWIIGTATQAGTGATRAFLLTPVPEPATVVLLLLGMLSLGLWSRSKTDH